MMPKHLENKTTPLRKEELMELTMLINEFEHRCHDIGYCMQAVFVTPREKGKHQGGLMVSGNHGNEMKDVLAALFTIVTDRMGSHTVQ